MTPVILAVIGTGVASLAVLVPLILTLHTRTAADLLQVRKELADMRRELLELRKDLADVDRRRLARIEGAVLGPWRPDPPEKEAAA